VVVVVVFVIVDEVFGFVVAEPEELVWMGVGVDPAMIEVISPCAFMVCA
jgi:hypothetical protein